MDFAILEKHGIMNRFLSRIIEESLIGLYSAGQENPMISNRKNKFRYMLKLSKLFYTFLFTLFLWTFAGSAFSFEITFLPLQINALENRDDLTLRVDSSLKEILAETTIQMIPRETAETFAEYTGDWPPPVKILQKIADTTQTDYIAAGNLTIIGGQISVDVKLFDILSPKAPTYYFQTAQSLDEMDEMLKKNWFRNTILYRKRFSYFLNYP